MNKPQRRASETAGDPVPTGADLTSQAELEKDPGAPEGAGEGEGDEEGAGAAAASADAPPPEQRAQAAASALARASAELDAELEGKAPVDSAAVLHRAIVGETSPPARRGAAPSTARPNKPSFDWKVVDGKLVPNLAEGEQIEETVVRHGVTIHRTSRVRFIYLCGIPTYEREFAELYPRVIWEQHYPQAVSDPNI